MVRIMLCRADCQSATDCQSALLSQLFESSSKRFVGLNSEGHLEFPPGIHRAARDFQKRRAEIPVRRGRTWCDSSNAFELRNRFGQASWNLCKEYAKIRVRVSIIWPQ